MNHKGLSELRDLVERWAQVASQVENGYVLSFDDYLNDMDLRRIVDEHLRAFTDSDSIVIPESTRDMLASADTQFREATDEIATNVWGEATALDDGWSADREWYYYRIPKSRPDWL